MGRGEGERERERERNKYFSFGRREGGKEGRYGEVKSEVYYLRPTLTTRTAKYILPATNINNKNRVF